MKCVFVLKLLVKRLELVYVCVCVLLQSLCLRVVDGGLIGGS